MGRLSGLERESSAEGGPLVHFDLSFDPEVLFSWPLDLASKMNAFPLCRKGTAIVLLVGNGLSDEQREVLESGLQMPVLAIPAEIMDLGKLLQQAGPQAGQILQWAEQLEDEQHFLKRYLEKGHRLERIAPRPLPQLLVELRLASETELGSAADSTDTESVFDPSPFIDSNTLQRVPDRVARRYRVLPLVESKGQLVLAAARFLDKAGRSEIRCSAGLEPVLVLTDPERLDRAIDSCYRRADQLGFQQMRLGEVMLARGLITREQLESGLSKQRKSGKKLGEILVESGHATEEMIYSSLAEKLGYEYQNFNYVDVDPEVSRVISQRFAESHMVIPRQLNRATEELVVAMAHPEDLAVVDLIKKLTKQRGYGLKLVVSTPTCIHQGIAFTYNTDDLREPEVEMETVDAEDSDRPDLVPSSEMPTIKKIVHHLLYQAVVDGASDIHLENLEARVRVRFRVDGILQLRETGVTKENIDQVISVLKVDSGLDITERRRPQDGVFRKRIGKDWYIDFRMNSHCTQFGMDAVIRILDFSKKLPKLDQLGLPERALPRYLQLIQNPQGLILITGPTGSGKSTTLYSTLSFLNIAERKIVTAEDPIEYQLPGIIQYQVNNQIGNTFAEYGRRFLRKDPDVILIGETRDETTAQSCIRAAMTGHLVFSTLHTNHSLAAVARLRALGIDQTSICDSLLAVIAQRLVRTVCDRCREEYEPEQSLIREFFGNQPPQEVTFVRGAGCPACSHTGYRGRIGVFEFWELSRECRIAIQESALEDDLATIAAKSGFKSLIEDALFKVFRGLTTLEELRRVIPLEQVRNRLLVDPSRSEERRARITALNPAG